MFVQRQRILGENRIGELLKLIQNFVIQAGIVMVGATEHDNADAILTFELVQGLTRALSDTRFVILHCLIAGCDGAVVLFQ